VASLDRPLGSARVFAGALVVAALVSATTPARASHFRGGNIVVETDLSGSVSLGVAGLSGHLCDPQDIFTLVGGAAQTPGGTQAVAWGVHPRPAAPTLLIIPDLPGDSEVLSGTNDDDDAAFCPVRFAGYGTDAGDHRKPVVWTLDENAGTFPAQELPLPPGYMGGEVEQIPFRPIGFSINLAGIRHGVIWWPLGKPPFWRVDLLPDYGPSFASEARASVIDPATGRLIVGGGAASPSSGVATCFWVEGASGTFGSPVFPSEGEGCIVAWSVGSGTTLNALSVRIIAGGIDFYRPAVQTRTNGVWGESLILPPLPGFRDAQPRNMVRGSGDSIDGLSVVGYSYNPDAGSETATLWEIDPDHTIEVYDVNDLTINLPPDIRLQTAAFAPVNAPPDALPIMVGTAIETGPAPGAGFQAGSAAVQAGDTHAYHLVFPATLAVSPVAVGGNRLLLRNHPNPFRGSTRIAFSLKSEQHVTLRVFDAAGRTVTTLLRGDRLNPGDYSLPFDGADLPAGMYSYRLQAGENVATGKMVLTE